MMGIVARSARVADGHADAVPDDVVARGETAAGEVPAPLARRGRPAAREGDRHVLDLHGRARPQRVDVHRARRRLDRRRLRRRAVLGRRGAVRAAARRRAGVRDADARGGRGDGRSRRSGSRTRSTRGKRIMGFGHRVYRAEDPRSRILKRDGAGARLAADRGRRAARGGGARRARAAPSRARRWRRTSSTTRRSCSTSPRSRRRSRPRCSRARASPAGRRTSSSRSAPGGSFRPSARVRRARRRARSPRVGRDPRRGGGRRRTRSREAGDERELADLRAQWDDEIEARRAERRLPRPRAGLSGDRPVPVPPEARAAASRARGREPGGARLGARSRSRGSRATHPGDVNTFRPLLHELAARDPNAAVRRLAVDLPQERDARSATRSSSSRGSPSRTTRTPELRKTARAVARRR